MDKLRRRNSPKTPNSEIPDAEILLPPFRKGEENGGRTSRPSFGGALQSAPVRGGNGC